MDFLAGFLLFGLGLISLAVVVLLVVVIKDINKYGL